MANTIKIFHLTQIYFESLGICPTNPNQKYAFSISSLFILLPMIVILSSTTLFFFTKAETTEEYLHTFYISTTEFTFIACFVVNIWKISVVLELIRKYDEFVQKSA